MSLDHRSKEPTAIRTNLGAIFVSYGPLVAETILASVHVRMQNKAGHMDASDRIKSLPHTVSG
jgi:hypothetical protein